MNHAYKGESTPHSSFSQDAHTRLRVLELMPSANWVTMLSAQESYAYGLPEVKTSGHRL
jgi:hypothetical protein